MDGQASNWSCPPAVRRLAATLPIRQTLLPHNVDAAGDTGRRRRSIVDNLSFGPLDQKKPPRPRSTSNTQQYAVQPFHTTIDTPEQHPDPDAGLLLPHHLLRQPTFAAPAADSCSRRRRASLGRRALVTRIVTFVRPAAAGSSSGCIAVGRTLQQETPAPPG